MRILVGQTRSQCANDVRKRERTIESMKKHVSEGGRARGSGKAVGVATINVVPGVGAEASNGGMMGLDDTGYDLRSETNEFLTELARGLSEENENLGGLLRRTVETLRALSGCEKGDAQEGGMVVQMECGYESLAAEMDFVIDHVRNLLTNPSFVPLEEVEVREEEIIRLREGWERMETRWKEAVQMMDGWRKRMARNGQTVNLEELKAGLDLSPLKPKELEDDRAFHLSTVEEEGDTQADIDAMDETDPAAPIEPEFDGDDVTDSDSSLFEEEPVEEEFEEVSEEQQQQQEEHEFSLNTASSLSPGLPPQLSPLRETSSKLNQGSPNQGQNDGFTTIAEENTWDLLQLDASSPAKKATPQSRKKEIPQLSVSPSDEICLLKTSNISQRSSPKKPSRSTPRSHPTSRPNSTPRLLSNGSSRLPRPRENPPQQSPLTMASIAAKLAATEREADAARVRAKLKAAKMNRSNPAVSATASDATKLMPPPPRREEQELEPTKGSVAVGDAEAEDARAARKRKATGKPQGGGRASRRRSTLSPWELESLITGGVASPAKGE